MASKNRSKPDEVTRIELDLDDISKGDVDHLTNSQLAEYTTKVRQEVERNDKIGIELVGQKRWDQELAGIRHAMPPSSLMDARLLDGQSSKSDSDNDLRSQLRYYILFRRGVIACLERLRNEQKESNPEESP